MHQIVETLAGQLFRVRPADVDHCYLGTEVKRVKGGFAPKKSAREILVRKLGTRVVGFVEA